MSSNIFLKYFDSEQDFSEDQVFFSTIYSYFDPFIAITKRSFNTKNVKEKLFPGQQKPAFAS